MHVEHVVHMKYMFMCHAMHLILYQDNFYWTIDRNFLYRGVYYRTLLLTNHIKGYSKICCFFFTPNCMILKLYTFFVVSPETETSIKTLKSQASANEKNVLHINLICRFASED